MGVVLATLALEWWIEDTAKCSGKGCGICTRAN
jgi:hypothetical protein